MKNMTVLHNRTCGNQWCRGYDAPSIGIRDYQFRHFDIRNIFAGRRPGTFTKETNRNKHRARNLWPKKS